MKATLTLLLACASIHTTAACSDEKRPSEEAAAKEAVKEAPAANADLKEALEGVPLKRLDAL